ncbi:unnamed protein product, partial [marine sediment metagenome]
ITLELGRISIERANIERRVAELDVFEEQLKVELVTVQQQEKAIANELVVKYGQGALNPETGIFTPQS